MNEINIAKKYVKVSNNTVSLNTNNSISADYYSLNKITRDTIASDTKAGMAVVAESTQEIAVTFDTAMEDTTYNITGLVVEEGTISSFAAGKITAYIKTATKATTGFTIRLATALAAGETVNVYWKVEK